MEIDDREHFADPLDVASAISEKYTSDAVAAFSRLAAPEQVQNEDGSWPVTECVDCDADLGARAKIGRIRCLRCQENLERRQKGLFTLRESE